MPTLRWPIRSTLYFGASVEFCAGVVGAVAAGAAAGAGVPALGSLGVLELASFAFSWAPAAWICAAVGMPMLVASGCDAGDKLSAFDGSELLCVDWPFACEGDRLAEPLVALSGAVVCAELIAGRQSEIARRANALFHAIAVVKGTREAPGTGTITPEL